MLCLLRTAVVPLQGAQPTGEGGRGLRPAAGQPGRGRDREGGRGGHTAGQDPAPAPAPAPSLCFLWLLIFFLLLLLPLFISCNKALLLVSQAVGSSLQQLAGSKSETFALLGATGGGGAGTTSSLRSDHKRSLASKWSGTLNRTNSGQMVTTPHPSGLSVLVLFPQTLLIHFLPFFSCFLILILLNHHTPLSLPFLPPHLILICPYSALFYLLLHPRALLLLLHPTYSSFILSCLLLILLPLLSSFLYLPCTHQYFCHFHFLLLLCVDSFTFSVNPFSNPFFLV